MHGIFSRGIEFLVKFLISSIFFSKKISNIFWTFHTNLSKTLKLFFINHITFSKFIFGIFLQLYQKIFLSQLRHHQSRNIGQNKPIYNFFAKKKKNFKENNYFIKVLIKSLSFFLKICYIFNTFLIKSFSGFFTLSENYSLTK